MSCEPQVLGYVLNSQTDSEVIAHLVDHLHHGNLWATVKAATR